MKSCSKGTTKLLVHVNVEDAPYDTFLGLVKLNPRIENVIGIRVLDMRFSYATSEEDNFRGGGYVFLESQKLASYKESNLFRYANGTGDGQGDSVCVCEGEIWSSALAMRFQETSDDATMSTINSYIPFARPSNLDEFDFRFGKTAGNYVETLAYGFDFIIEFTHQCTC